MGQDKDRCAGKAVKKDQRRQCLGNIESNDLWLCRWRDPGLMWPSMTATAEGIKQVLPHGCFNI